MSTKNYLYSLLFTVCLLWAFTPVDGQGTAYTNNGGGSTGQGYKTKWSVAPIDHKVFIENKGQFDKSVDATPGATSTTDGVMLPHMTQTQINSISSPAQGLRVYNITTGCINIYSNGWEAIGKVLYAVQEVPMFAYFTPNGVVYRYDEYPIRTEKQKEGDDPAEDPDMKAPEKPVVHVLTATWQNSSNNVSVEGGEEQPDFYAYETGPKSSMKVNIFKKITYKNLYPNIDVEYIFPKDKGGVKYTIIVHPGGDPSLVKLKYDGAKDMHIDASGNVVINSGWGNFTDHAPVTYYEDKTPVPSSYDITNSVESFVVNNLNASKTLMIDPWTTNWTNTSPFTTTSSYDGAYDVDYDYQGNVWVYGSWQPLQLVKFNSAGVKQWTFNTTTFNTGYYGDFSIDKFDGTAYCTEGFNGAGAQAEKISTTGVLVATSPGTSGMEEMWRIVFDPCHRDFPVGGGGFSQVQACMLDTTMVASVTVNVLSATAGEDTHDMTLDAPDPSGNFAYMATAHSVAGDPTHFSNDVLQMAQTTLVPTTYIVADNYNFQESSVPTYVGPGGATANGMNGMAASPNWLYLYDGETLKQLNKNTGALNTSATISGTMYSWGGLDVDECDNVYAGNNNNIGVYNSSLALTSTIGPLTSTVYDVVLGNGYTTLYTCGKGFLTSIALSPLSAPVIDKVVTPSNCFCSGKCKATLMLCGNPDTTNVTYLWSNGQTTQTATNLCAGIDSVKITVGCGVFYTDTVKITGGASVLTVVRDSTSATCTTPGTASVSITGGHAPYTYSWSNGATTSAINNLGAGVYCVTYFDNTGCSDSLCITVPGVPLPTIVISPNPDTICVGSSVALTASGGNTYTWAPATGLSCTTCPNTVASPVVTTTYTVIGTDQNGCQNKDSVVVTVLQPPVITITPPSDTICAGNSVNLTASGAVNYTWTPAAGLSCTNCPNPIANPTVTTDYSVIGTDAHGCSGSTNVIITLEAPPTINVSASATSICNGNSVTLTASATGITSPYTWQPGSLTGLIVVVTPSVTTTYTVSGYNACDTSKQTITIVVNPLPLPDFSADVTEGCSPLCIQFRDKTTLTSGRISTWTWKFGDGDSVNGENPIYCYPNSGIYTVDMTATTDSGCSATLKILNMITVYSHPIAAFTLSPQPTNILSPTIQFTDKSTDKYGIVYRFWKFGDFDTVYTEDNPSHTYQDTGTYCAQLVVMNVHGCTDTAVNCLVIDPIYCLYIPDAFTPNGNGVNDVFLAKGNDVKSFEMYIYDRWGMQLFHSTDINIGWDGKVKGSNTVSQEDTYVYLINATDHLDHKHTYIGKVNLIK